MQWLNENKYFPPDILNVQVSSMGLHVLRKVLEDIRVVPWFFIIFDVGNTEQLAICIHWVDANFEIHEAPVELINIPKTDAATLASAIKDSLARLSLPIGQCRGQAYDGMKGVAAKIQRDVPSVLFVHCLVHCMNLTLQATGHQCVPVRDALDLIMELTKLIRYSPKRSAQFESLQAKLSPDSGYRTQSFKPLSTTRWTARTKAFESVLSN